MNDIEERIKALEEATTKEIELINRLIDITGEQQKQIKDLIQILKER